MHEVLVKNEEFKDSPLGNIPKNWEISTIGEKAFISSGTTPSRSVATYWQNGRISWVKTGEVNYTLIQNTEEKVTQKALYETSLTLYPVGTVLVAMYGQGLTRGKVGILGIEATTNQACAAIIPKDENLIPSYLFHYLSYHYQDIRSISHGSNQSNLSESLIASFRIRLPPREEQKKIAEILDTVDDAIACTSSLIIKLKQTKAGLLQDLLTRGLDENGKLRDPEAHPEQFKDLALGRIPQKWTVKEFGEYIAHLDSGWSPICEAEPVANGEWGVLKTTAVVWSGYNPSESKKLPSNLEPRYSSVVETDDILITRKGPRERVGVVVHIPSTPANLMMPDTVFRVRLKESSPLLPAFIPLTLGSVAVQQDWNRKKVGLAEAQVDINYGIVRETIIYIPPKSEQKYIIQILNTYNTRIRTEEAYLNKLKLQKQGLMQDLLTGKVRLNSIK